MLPTSSLCSLYVPLLHIQVFLLHYIYQELVLIQCLLHYVHNLHLLST
jgi:hypothetical protein